MSLCFALENWVMENGGAVPTRNLANEAQEIVNLISRYLNGYGLDSAAAITVGLGSMHRTIQQNFMAFVMYYIADTAKSSRYDLRNEASVTLCKNIVRLLEENNINCYLPHI